MDWCDKYDDYKECCYWLGYCIGCDGCSNALPLPPDPKEPNEVDE